MHKALFERSERRNMIVPGARKTAGGREGVIGMEESTNNG